MKKYYLVLLLSVPLSLFVSAQNVGIGTASPAYKLDVSGTVHSTGTLTVDNSIIAGGSVTTAGSVTAAGNVAATGDVTAHGGGVLYNTVSPAATNMKVYYRTAAFTVTNLAAHSVTIEASVGIGGGFTAPPMVFVGDIVANAAEAGQASPGPLHQLQLITYGSTTGQFNIRILNTSNVAISQTITWNIMCIGH
jgi:hypothetical protein